MNNSPKYKLLSLFSGGGFLDLGFLKKGFSISSSVEINPQFIVGYNYGIKSYFENTLSVVDKTPIPFIERPIDASDIVAQELLKKKYKYIDGIIGGPPCQDYSVGGKNAGINGERGKLIWSYLKIMKDIRPKFIFFENVAGLLNNVNHKKSLFALIEEMERDGYIIWYDILNSLEYGIPQDRPRLAIVGFRKDIIDKLYKAGYKVEKDNRLLKISDDDNLAFRWPKIKYNQPKKMNWPKKWAFGYRPSEQDLNSNSDLNQLIVLSAFENLNDATPNQNEYFNPRSVKFNEIAEGDTDRKSFKRLHRCRYSPTVAYGNNEVHLHPTEARRLSVREALRLQTVPDEYVLPKEMTLTAKFKLISNGVPVKKAELIAMEIKRTLELYYSL